MKLCHKEKFSKIEAATILNQCKREHRPECRIYECPICIENGEKLIWHLTSEPEYEEKIYLKEEELIFCEQWKKLKMG